MIRQTNGRDAKAEHDTPRKPTQTQPPGATSTWAVVIRLGKEVDRLGAVEAPDLREAYRLAIEQYNVPVERQKRLFVRRLRSA